MSDWILEFVDKLGYIGIALLTLAENIFPPIPSELIMPLAGFQSTQGNLTLFGAIMAGSVGSLAGACGWYWLGRRIGEARLRRWTERHGRWIAIDVHDLDRAKDWFRRHGVWAVFLCRLMPGLRTYISLPAGLDGMPLAKFLLPSAAGTFLWTAGLTWAGYVLGANYAAVKDYVGIASWVVIGIVAVLYISRQVRWNHRRSVREGEA